MAREVGACSSRGTPASIGLIDSSTHRLMARSARAVERLRVPTGCTVTRRLAARRLAAAGVAKPDRRRRRQRLRAGAPPLRRRRPDALAAGVVARAREEAAGAEERVAQRRVVGAVVDPCGAQFIRELIQGRLLLILLLPQCASLRPNSRRHDLRYRSHLPPLCTSSPWAPPSSGPGRCARGAPCGWCRAD